MSHSNVASFAKKKAEREADAGFLDLLHDDIASNPDSVKPIPSGLLNRIQALRAKADQNRRSELQEG